MSRPTQTSNGGRILTYSGYSSPTVLAKPRMVLFLTSCGLNDTLFRRWRCWVVALLKGDRAVLRDGEIFGHRCLGGDG